MNIREPLTELKRWTINVIAAAAVLISALGFAPDVNAGSKSFPDCFVGTFLVDEGNGTKSLWTLGTGGVFFVTSSAQAALDFTDEQGAWIKTGKRRAGAISLDFSFDPDGGLANIAKVNADVTFTGNNCSGIEGDFTVSFYDPEVDPLDPDSVPENVVSDTFTGRRVTVEQ
jgi:hypothetical protein